LKPFTRPPSFASRKASARPWLATTTARGRVLRRECATTRSPGLRCRPPTSRPARTGSSCRGGPARPSRCRASGYVRSSRSSSRDRGGRTRRP
jgi:hypothetical protein